MILQKANKVGGLGLSSIDWLCRVSNQDGTTGRGTDTQTDPRAGQRTDTQSPEQERKPGDAPHRLAQQGASRHPPAKRKRNKNQNLSLNLIQKLTQYNPRLKYKI